MIQELHAGDRQIPASGWNEMRVAVQGITPGQQQYQSAKLNPVYITVKNATTTDLPAFSVVKLDGSPYSRSGDEFVNQAIKNGVEMTGYTPVGASDIVAITQAACAAGEFVRAIVSGATACKAIRPANRPDDIQVYKYAKPIAGETGCIELSPTPTNIRILWHGANGASTSAPAMAYVVLDWIDDRQTFTVPANLASVAKKGAVFKIVLGNNGWKIQSNFAQSSKYILAVCQEDMDDNATEPYQMPFYTPEQNYGVAPNTLVNSGIVSGSWQVGRRGVGTGDNAFSNKRLDYAYQHGQYTYEPRFIYTGAAVSYNSGVGIVIEGHTYAVVFPSLASSYNSSMMAPDVYAGDIITVLVEEAHTGDYGATVTAIEYPTDFAKGSSIVVEGTMLMRRGWDEDYITGTDFKYAIKVQGAALI